MRRGLLAIAFGLSRTLLCPPAVAMTAVLVLAAAVAGCSTTPATSVTFSYDPRFSFADSKTYSWAKRGSYGTDALVEANVRFLTDRDFQAKGLSLTGDNPALVAWVGYEPYYYYGAYFSSPSDLRVLTLNVARAADRELVWQGRAKGSIRTDASSDELRQAVEGMLAKFPPK